MPNSQASFEISLRVNAMYGVPVMLVLYILLGFSVACPVDDYTLTVFSDFFLCWAMVLHTEVFQK